ncbi:hypothetical protein BpHYR1_011172 [Brachionus plicatilis]|uniref:Uncharacterized protein n=1 Tax=Brachionus plicatilis TaxID=10195 RepID=A0A3M7T7C7_BRAPC|nr:hypothetical protein BpHYR1_011172 [Brachionus plicatilis]
MAARGFVSFLKSQTDSFDFKIFKNDYLIQISPIKMPISYKTSINETAYLFRDSIVTNLASNKFFYNNIHEVSSFRYFCQLLEETDQGNVNENQIGRLTLLLHVKNTNEFDFKNDLLNFFYQIKSNDRITKRIAEIVFSITQVHDVQFDFIDLKINFFKFGLIRLNGFAGLDSIYIGIDAIKYFMNMLSEDYENKQKLEVFRLNMFRLIIHETCHVALRKTLNNFNASSPSFQSKNETDSKQADIFEAGVLCEKSFFSERIDWALSTKNPEFDLNYCADFLTKLLNEPTESDSDFPKFDFKRSGCLKNPDKLIYMAIDFSSEIDML